MTADWAANGEGAPWSAARVRQWRRPPTLGSGKRPRRLAAGLGRCSGIAAVAGQNEPPWGVNWRPRRRREVTDGILEGGSMGRQVNAERAGRASNTGQRSRWREGMTRRAASRNSNQGEHARSQSQQGSGDLHAMSVALDLLASPIWRPATAGQRSDMARDSAGPVDDTPTMGAPHPRSGSLEAWLTGAANLTRMSCGHFSPGLPSATRPR